MQGNIGIWSPETDSNVREGKSHQNISCLEWSPNGNRLVSGDEEGCIVVWKVDLRGKLASLSKYRLQAPIQHVLFKNASKKTRDSRYKCFNLD
jgi:WD40 repeat protein